MYKSLRNLLNAFDKLFKIHGMMEYWNIGIMQDEPEYKMNKILEM